MLPVLFQIGFGGFPQIIQNMVNLGFFQFLFPFLLALAIFYGLLRATLPTQLPNSSAALVSLILAFFVMLFASANPGIVGFFQNISGTGLIVGTGVLFLLIILGLTGFNIAGILKDPKGGHVILLLLIVAIVIVLFFGATTQFLLPSVTVGSDFWTIIFFIIILALVLWVLGKGGGAPTAAPTGGRTPG